MDPSKPRNLSFVNLSNDEINFISSLKIDLIQLQEEIDRLDIDGLLRNPKINTFTKYPNLVPTTYLIRKNYVVSMKKFLGRVSPIDSLSELEQRSSMDIDPNKIKSLLNVEEYPEALAKLYRIISKNFLVGMSNHDVRYTRADAFEVHRVRDPIIP